jgi:uncharacterized membrane protein
MKENLRSSAIANIFQRIHPIVRIVIGLVMAGVVFLLLKKEGRSNLVVGMCAWCVFSFTYLLISWIIIFSRRIEDIKKIARVNDGSQLFVALLIMASSFASLVIVMLLIVNPNPNHQQMIIFPLSMASIILSWIMVHTIMAFHYAHKYYDDDSKGIHPEEGGLDFPGDDKPDYLDFAYYSFVIGMTFQVSDVEITSKKLRKLALLHGLIAFGLNTFVVALTINLIAGLSK